MKINFFDFLIIILCFAIAQISDFFERIYKWTIKHYFIILIACFWVLLPFLFVWVENAPLIGVAYFHLFTVSVLIFAYLWKSFFERKTKLWYLISKIKFIHAYLKGIKTKKVEKRGAVLLGGDRDITWKNAQDYEKALEDLKNFENSYPDKFPYKDAWRKPNEYKSVKIGTQVWGKDEIKDTQFKDYNN